MMRLNSAIVRLAFMKLSEMTMVAIQDCKSTHKIVFIAKLVISKTHHKILCGSAPRVEAGQITPICEGDFGQSK